MLKKLLITAVFFTAAAVLLFISPIRYPVSPFFPVKGVDVSHHQGKVNWDSAGTEEIHFAWIKASEGGDFRDSMFQTNWAETKRVGIPRGAYHFLTFCRPGKIQAQNFIGAVKSFDPEDLIPAVDIEYDGNCKRRLSQQEMDQLLSDFTAELRRYSTQPPILYMTKEIYQDYFRNSGLENRIWIRAVLTSPRRACGPEWSVWQYNHRGRLAGFTGPVDLNTINGKSLESFYNR